MKYEGGKSVSPDFHGRRDSQCRRLLLLFGGGLFGFDRGFGRLFDLGFCGHSFIFASGFLTCGMKVSPQTKGIMLSARNIVNAGDKIILSGAGRFGQK
jgi:hypothetical protein